MRRTVEVRCPRPCGNPLAEMFVDDDGATTARWFVRNDPMVSWVKHARSTSIDLEKIERDRSSQREPVEMAVDALGSTIVAWCERCGNVDLPKMGFVSRHAEAERTGTVQRWRGSTPT